MVFCYEEEQVKVRVEQKRSSPRGRRRGGVVAMGEREAWTVKKMAAAPRHGFFALFYRTRVRAGELKLSLHGWMSEGLDGHQRRLRECVMAGYC